MDVEKKRQREQETVAKIMTTEYVQNELANWGK